MLRQLLSALYFYFFFYFFWLYMFFCLLLFYVVVVRGRAFVVRDPDGCGAAADMAKAVAGGG